MASCEFGKRQEPVASTRQASCGAAADASGAQVCLPQEERIGLEAEDVVVADGGVVGELEHGTEVLAELFRATSGPGP